MIVILARKKPPYLTATIAFWTLPYLAATISTFSIFQDIQNFKFPKF
jgi:hypothetical protein